MPGQVNQECRLATCSAAATRLRSPPAMAYYAVKMRGMNLNKPLLIMLLGFSCNSMAAWVEYSTGANGDVFYFDDARVQKDGDLVNVWNRIRYKTSVMGASSYQSLIEIDCSEYSETTLQRTFYSDKNWTTRAMATDMKMKPNVSIDANSATQRLADRLCQE